MLKHVAMRVLSEKLKNDAMFFKHEIQILAVNAAMRIDFKDTKRGFVLISIGLDFHPFIFL